VFVGHQSIRAIRALVQQTIKESRFSGVRWTQQCNRYQWWVFAAQPPCRRSRTQRRPRPHCRLRRQHAVNQSATRGTSTAFPRRCCRYGNKRAATPSNKRRYHPVLFVRKMNCCTELLEWLAGKQASSRDAACFEKSSMRWTCRLCATRNVHSRRGSTNAAPWCDTQETLAGQAGSHDRTQGRHPKCIRGSRPRSLRHRCAPPLGGVGGVRPVKVRRARCVSGPCATLP